MKKNTNVAFKYRPADLARAAGVHRHTIQRWTTLGMLDFDTNEKGWRFYSLTALGKAIELAKSSRCPLKERTQKQQ